MFDMSQYAKNFEECTTQTASEEETESWEGWLCQVGSVRKSIPPKSCEQLPGRYWTSKDDFRCDPRLEVMPLSAGERCFSNERCPTSLIHNHLFIQWCSRHEDPVDRVCATDGTVRGMLYLRGLVVDTAA